MAESDPAGVTATSLYRRLLGYARPHWRIFVIAVLAMVLVAATETGFAAIMKPLLDGNFIERDPATIVFVPVALLLLFLFRGLASFGLRYGMALIGRRVILQLREELFHTFLRLPTRYYDNNTAGRLLSRLTFDVEQVAEASTNAVTILIRDTLTLTFLLGYMFWTSGWLTLLFLLVGPVLVVLIRYVSRRFQRISRRIQDSMGELTQFSDEAIHGQRLIKMFNAEHWQETCFSDVNERNRKLHMRMAAVAGASTPVIQFLLACVLALVVYLATLESISSEISVGSFVSFIVAMMLLMQPMKRLTNVNASLQRGLAASRSIFGVLDESREDTGGKLRLQHARGAIEFRNVSFAYDTLKGNVLENLSFVIEPGQSIALVGRSGSGKSTLAQMLVRFRDPDSGSVLLDGEDIREYRLADLRSQIGMVSQDVILFNDSIRSNIAFGSLDDVSEQDIIAAAEAANAMAFIRELPKGLDTRIGDRGGLLSGGQRQRLAIARTILKNAPLLVLDEATSALDSESERLVQDALEQLMQQRTSLIIAHRLSTVEHADRILVLEKGTIVETGSHAELLAKQGVYADLYRLQFGDTRVT